MKVIALDQNAVSNLAFPPSSIWVEILDLLKAGVGQGKLLCPTPTETISETTHLSRNQRDAIMQTCAGLSRGYFFRFPWETIALEVLAKVRAGIDTFPFWIPPRITESEEAENERSSRAIWKEKIEFEREVNIPEIKQFRLLPGRNEFPIAKLAYRSAVEWLKLVRGYLNKLRNDKMLGDEQFIIQQICRCLIELKVTDTEISGLLQGIRNGEWLEIRMLTCWFLLDGFFMYDQLNRGRYFEYNDEWDKYRAGDAFHSAHCFITDRGMASALRQLKLEIPDYFEVFSVAEPKRIVSYLQTAIGTGAC